MTDKIKPATDEQISGLRKHLEAMEYPNQQYFSMIGSEALSLIARIEAQQAEIEELKSERDVDVIGERDQAAKLLAEATKEIERLNDELQAQVESYRDRVSEIERLRGLCERAGECIEAHVILDSGPISEKDHNTYGDLVSELYRNSPSKGESHE